MSRAARGAARRFLLAAVHDRPTGCVLWPHATTTTGYGLLRYEGRMWKAHRLALHLAGADVDGYDVCHSCDTPLCINPAHLFVGTTTDNMRDASVKGRTRRGERHPAAKLTAEQVRLIRSDPRAQARIAADFGISQMSVSLIKSRKNWGWLP